MEGDMGTGAGTEYGKGRGSTLEKSINTDFSNEYIVLHYMLISIHYRNKEK